MKTPRLFWDLFSVGADAGAWDVPQDPDAAGRRLGCDPERESLCKESQRPLLAAWMAHRFILHETQETWRGAVHGLRI